MFLREVLFADRSEAGRALAQRLLKFKDERPVVLALPRGGVPVGFEVARTLEAPLDLILVRKIGAPFQPELAVGAVVDGGRAETVVNEDLVREFQIPESYIAEESARQLEEIERRRKLYLAESTRGPVEGHTAIVVDDGIATGATMEAALHATRRANPRRLVLATGNITIDPKVMVIDGSRIRANAPAGFGGRVTIVADNILVPGGDFEALLARGDISATGGDPAPARSPSMRPRSICPAG